MASPPILTPTGTGGWNYTKFSKTVEGTTYNLMDFIKSIEEAERLYGGLTIRKHARVSASVLAQSADGTILTASNIIGTPVTLTPAGNYIMVQWSRNEEAQLDFDLQGEGEGNIKQALSESTEQGGLANATSLTQIMSQASVDASMLRRAYGRLMGNTNGMARPGKKPQVYGIFSHTAYPDLATIPEFNAADVRGGSETPYVEGIWTKGGGIILKMSTVITADANGWHNVLYLPSAFKVSWNVRTESDFQKDELTRRLIVYNNLGTGVIHDLRALDLRTTVSAL